MVGGLGGILYECGKTGLLKSHWTVPEKHTNWKRGEPIFFV